MSRVGKAVIEIPPGINVVASGGMVEINGGKGRLTYNLPKHISVSQKDAQLIVERSSEAKTVKSAHGLTRALLNNMVKGVSNGFSKELELEGVGYRVSQAGQELVLSIGYSHPIKFKIPEGISAAVEQNKITISGIDKQKVGQIAAEIRAIRKPEPYKGKGIHYKGERIIRKAGKSGKEQA